MADKFSKQLAIIEGMIAGFTTALPGGATTFVLGNTSYTQTALVTMLGGIQSILSAVPAAELARATAVNTRTENEANIDKVVENTTSALRGALGSSPTALATYGIKPIKARVPLTSEQKVARAAKAAATRKARGTLGKKQKAAIHGTVPEAPVTIPPVVPVPKGP
jgi:hypothetical protein